MTPRAVISQDVADVAYWLLVRELQSSSPTARVAPRQDEDAAQVEVPTSLGLRGNQRDTDRREHVGRVTNPAA